MKFTHTQQVVNRGVNFGPVTSKFRVHYCNQKKALWFNDPHLLHVGFTSVAVVLGSLVQHFESPSRFSRALHNNLG